MRVKKNGFECIRFSIVFISKFQSKKVFLYSIKFCVKWFYEKQRIWPNFRLKGFLNLGFDFLEL